MRILVVEDNPVERVLLKGVVEGLGHDCLTASDGEEAWDLLGLEHGAVDVVISDWRMPRVEGPELCRRIRQHLPHYTYVILNTMLDQKQHALDGMKSGADDYLMKPLNIEALEARLIAAARVTSLHRRREALLRVARRFALESHPELLLDALLDESQALLHPMLSACIAGASMTA